MIFSILPDDIAGFAEHLRREERAPATIEKYIRDVAAFARWAEGRAITKELVAAWKEVLRTAGRAAVTINGALAALNSFFCYIGWDNLRVRYLKVQRKAFRDVSKELSREEYNRLVQTAQRQGKHRLALLLETICATGIRVSEVKYITLEAVRRGRADVSLKGKVRTILIPNKLARKLLKYAKKQKIACGEIFLTASGCSLSRRQIWGEMKQLCRAAGVDESKVFPHNLRHLFARTFYKSCRDIVRLADVLGHSSVETTRIYLVTTSAEYSRYMDGLGLVT